MARHLTGHMPPPRQVATDDVSIIGEGVEGDPMRVYIVDGGTYT